VEEKEKKLATTPVATAGKETGQDSIGSYHSPIPFLSEQPYSLRFRNGGPVSVRTAAQLRD
jgi:hypothetical protein